MNPHYNPEYSRSDIEEILVKIQDCIISDHYTISLNSNRQENQAFIDDYNISHSRRRAILLQIKPEDFCHTLQNTNPGYEHETLYVFVPQVELSKVDGILETVDVYIKFNILERPNGNRTIVISFHQRNKPVEYCFR